MYTKRLGYASARNLNFSCRVALFSSSSSTLPKSIAWYFFARSNKPASSAFFKCPMMSREEINAFRPSTLAIYARVEWEIFYIFGITWWRNPAYPRIIAIGNLASKPKIRFFLSLSLIGTLMSIYLFILLIGFCFCLQFNQIFCSSHSSSIP